MERIRDVKPEYNTLMAIDEILPMGLNILLFRNDAPIHVREDGTIDSFDISGNPVIDIKWISGQRLDSVTGDADLQKVADHAHYELDSFNLEFSRELGHNLDHQVFHQRLDKQKELERQIYKAQAEYEQFRPSVLSERIRQADVVIVPESLAAKIEAEVPEAKIAVLAEKIDGSIPMRVPIIGQNYPRVVVRKWPDGLQHYGEPRVDATTINLLMDSNKKTRSDSIYLLDMDSLERNMDPLFYQALRRMNFPVSLAIKRTEVPKKGYALKYGREENCDILGGEEFIDDASSFDRRVINSFRPNGYGLGRSTYYAGFHSIDLAGGYESGKKRKIRELYENMWLTPLDSIDEIVERQKLIEELLANDNLFKRLQNLSHSLNGLYGAHLHLEGMSRNLAANLLHSKWGARIIQKPFYLDFSRLAQEFISAYEITAQNVSGIKSSSRELQAMFDPLAYFMEEGNDLHAAYSFLKAVMSGNPTNYSQLADSFKREINQLGVRRIDELENYGKIDTPQKKGEKIGIRGYKTLELKRIVNQFFGQIPVTRAKRAVGYLDYAGSKIAAYAAYANFMRREGRDWTKPDIAAPELGLIDIKNGWYPLTRLQHTPDFVRNDTYLDNNQRIEILDGANIGGKTIDLKKTLFIVLLALSGSYVPAEHARVSFFDGLRYRIKQTGMHESGALHEELKNIQSALRLSEGRCLYGFDETFTSTNDVEGEAMTYGLSKRLALQPAARAIFTSHYPSLHELTQDAALSVVKFSHFTFSVKNGKLVFSHKKMNGPNNIGDYAIAIAEHEGIPKGIIAHARMYNGGSGA